MAPCDQGYLCDVCGEEVTSIRESDLYLRFVTGQIESRELLTAQERHLRCNPVAAQFIEAPEFKPISVDGPFAKLELDLHYARERAELITRGWHRLQELAELSQTLQISEYPLPEFRRGQGHVGRNGFATAPPGGPDCTSIHGNTDSGQDDIRNSEISSAAASPSCSPISINCRT